MNPPSSLLAEVGRATVQCGIDQLYRIQIGDAFSETVLKLRRGTILTSGIGKSGLVARHTAASLTSIGQKCTYLHPCDAMHGDLGAVDPWVAHSVVLRQWQHVGTAGTVRFAASPTLLEDRRHPPRPTVRLRISANWFCRSAGSSRAITWRRSRRRVPLRCSRSATRSV